MVNKKYLFLGAVGGLLIAVINSQKIKSGIVDILISIKRTFYNEGTWVAEDSHQAKDIGNYYPTSPSAPNRIYYGTNYGITAAFLVEHFKTLQIPITDKNVIRDITAEQSREIYRKVIGGRMRYEEFQNQAVADFIFDWMIQRPSTCIAYMTEKVFGYTIPEKKAEINRAQFSDRLLNGINASDPARIYNSLKFWRFYHLTYTEVYRSFRPGIFKRIARYKDFPNTPDVDKMEAIAKAKANQYIKKK
jgi:hypothetical protein